MFRWYANAQQCYVYLSDVETQGNKSQISWESDFRKSRWFTRGWTLQELLAPDVVEFFSQEGDFLRTKQTLAQIIHEVTTLPLDALRGTSLTQFPIKEKVRWAERRQTKETEDRAYCLLGIFDVYMPLLYGEGDNEFYRLREQIDKRFGGHVSGRLGVLDDDDRSLGLYQRSASLNNVDEFSGQATEFGKIAPVSRPYDSRPTKRARKSYDANACQPSNNLPNCNRSIDLSHMRLVGGELLLLFGLNEVATWTNVSLFTHVLPVRLALRKTSKQR